MTDRKAGAPPRRFTRATLAEFDGKVAGRPVLVAFEGKVYDVTGSYPWHGGWHWGCALAGRDESGKMDETVHGREMLARVTCVGELVEDDRGPQS